MFGQDAIRNAYPRRRRRRGWGRLVLLLTGLLIVSARLAYGSGSAASERVIVAPGDTVWSIALSHYAGDPRPHVEAILEANHLSTPLLTPGEALQLPSE